MTLDQFFQKWNGKFADFDNQYPNQCVDLGNFYNRDVWGNPNKISGNAWQWWDNAPKDYYDGVSTPVKGDIAVWKKEFGGYGHVAIVWDNGKFFSQNYPLGAPCSLQSISTNKILGYLRPKPMAKFERIKEKFVKKMTGRDEDMTIPYLTKINGKSVRCLIRRTASGEIIEKKNISEREFNSNLSIWD